MWTRIDLSVDNFPYERHIVTALTGYAAHYIKLLLLFIDTIQFARLDDK